MQAESHPDRSVFPSITATLGSVSWGYWGAFQLTGDNKSDLVDSGVGAENDFILKYTGTIDDGLAFSAMLTTWLYPFADEAVAGTATPMYIEHDPPAKDRAFDLALNVSAAIPFDDVYITPQVHAAYVTRHDTVVPDATFSDSFVAWVGVHVGYDIAL